jgi:uncharacterized membrane protein
MAPSYNQISGRSLSRIEALSDGLFAIAMTLIVLEIRVPDPGGITTEGGLWAAIVALTPRIVTYLLSFLTLGIFWNAQQTQLNHFRAADRNLSWIHLTFLATVAVMPFSTSLLAEFITFRLALVVYWLNLLALGVTIYASWSYAGRAGLHKEEVTAELSRIVRRRIVAYQALYAFGALLCVINTFVSIGFIVLLQLNSAIAPRVRWLSRF